MRVISFSLYGNSPLYLNGAICNARSVEAWYPGWQCWFYVGSSVPRDVCEQLEAARARVIHMATPETSVAMLWRFQPAREKGVQALMVRDCDSRFSKREQAAVLEWLTENTPFHIMRDHPAHRVPILGGMWGTKGNNGLAVIRKALEEPLSEDFYGIDQFLLAQYVYPHIKKAACIHDAYFCYELHSRPFPAPRDDYGFVGEVFNPNSEPNHEQRAEVKYADTSMTFRLRLKAGSIKDKVLHKGYWKAVS